MFQSAQPSRICVRALINCAAASAPDRQAAAALIGIDAALLAAALRWLDCAATPAAIERSLESLDDRSMRALVVLLVEPDPFHEARNDATRWHAQHRAGALAAVLAAEIGLEPTEQRLRAILDLAAVDSPRAAQLNDVGRYRNHALDDLVDAHVAVRIAITLSAVAESRPEHAAVLFGIDAYRWQGLEYRAQESAAAQLTQLGLADYWTDADESREARELEVLLPRLRAASYWSAAARPEGGRFELGAARLVEAALQAPAALYLANDSSAVEHGSLVLRCGAEALTGLPVSATNSRSKVAGCFATSQSITIARWDTTAVVDQQIMNALGCETLCLTPIVQGGARRGVLLTGTPAGLGIEQLRVVLGWYAATLADLLVHEQQIARSDALSVAALRADFQRQIKETVHEANNPLGIMQNYLHIVLGRAPEEPELREPLEIVLREINRTAMILQRLALADLPHVAVSATLTEVSVLVADIGRLFSASAAAQGVEFVVQTDAEPGVAIRDADVVRQILTNLLLNGAEAATTGGHLRLNCRTNVFRNGRRQAVITVKDNGPGIALDHLQALLVAKSTNKGPGHAGVGLAVAHRLATQIGASLDCESGPSGTTFTLLLASAE